VSKLKITTRHATKASLFPQDLYIQLFWNDDAQVRFWLTPKERKQLRKTLKHG